MTAVSHDLQALAERRYSAGRASLPTFSLVFCCQIFLQCYWSWVLTFSIFLQKPFLIFCPFWLARTERYQMAQAQKSELPPLVSQRVLGSVSQLELL